MNKTIRKGFTLVEMLVVVSIIGILATISVMGIQSAREKSKVAKAKNDVSRIGLAVTLLYSDTRKYPGYWPTLQRINQEVRDLSSIDAGLVTAHKCESGAYNSSTSSTDFTGYDNTASSFLTTPCYSNWNGPYYNGTTKDPWGRNYLIDYDYYGAPYEKVQAVVLTLGKNPSSSVNSYLCDDIYRSLASWEPQAKVPPGWIPSAGNEVTNLQTKRGTPCVNFNGSAD